MATHSSIPAWRFPWTGETGELQSRGSERFRHDLTPTHSLTAVLQGSLVFSINKTVT